MAKKPEVFKLNEKHVHNFIPEIVAFREKSEWNVLWQEESRAEGESLASWKGTGMFSLNRH